MARLEFEVQHASSDSTEAKRKVTRSPGRGSRSPGRGTRSPGRGARSPGRVRKSRSESRDGIAVPRKPTRSSSRNRVPTSHSSDKTVSSKKQKKEKTTKIDKSETTEKSADKIVAPDSMSSVKGTEASTVTKRIKQKSEISASEPTSRRKLRSSTLKVASSVVITKSEESFGHRFCRGMATFFSIFLLPLFVVTINLMCTPDICKLIIPVYSSNVSHWIHPGAFLTVALWLSFHVLCALLPFGQVVKSSYPGSKLTYRCNGLVSLLLSLLFLSYIWYAKRWLLSSFIQSFFFIMTAVIITVTFVSLLLLWKAGKSNQSKSGVGNLISDLFFGREMNPRLNFGRFGAVDLKFILLRPGCIGWIMLELSWFLMDWDRTPDRPNFAFLGIVLCHLFYVGDLMRHESTSLGSSRILREGLGFVQLFESFVWTPYVASLGARYVLFYSPDVSIWTQVVAFIILILGYGVHRGSLSERYSFLTKRKNILAKTSVVFFPSKNGSPLYASSWWAVCRHPNYLGQILMVLGTSMLCGTSSAIPWIFPVFSFFHLLYRAKKHEILSSEEHGSSWDSYCLKVPKRLIPLIY